MKFTVPDIIIFLVYCCIVIGVGIIISRKVNRKKDSNSYYFAGSTLPWYLIGSSIIAANISAEQFVGMSGSGFAMGLTIATYEWLAAIMLVMVAWWFLPVFMHKRIYTMPQFLEVRYNHRIKTVLAIFWLFLFIFVNLTSILYLGALSLKTVFGVNMGYGITGLALFSVFLAAGGGLKTIANTDVIQVVFLVAGGLVTTYLALNTVSDGHGVFSGFQLLMEKALGAKNLQEAQRGMVFAGYLKLIIPILVVIPGISAFVLHADIARPDEAYPWLLDRFVPSGVKGFVFAALIAAIISSLSAIINSASTIFSIDIYKVHFRPRISEAGLVKTGRISSLIIIILAATLASMLTGINQVFQFIQEYTGLVSPGITALFILGIFWKKTTARAAWIAVLITIPVPVFLKWIFPSWPFLDNMALSFLIISTQIIVMSLCCKRPESSPAWELPPDIFHNNDRVFKWFSLGIVCVLCALYIYFW
jgi:SSS family solute:Na+ symporter